MEVLAPVPHPWQVLKTSWLLIKASANLLLFFKMGQYCWRPKVIPVQPSLWKEKRKERTCRLGPFPPTKNPLLPTASHPHQSPPRTAKVFTTVQTAGIRPNCQIQPVSGINSILSCETKELKCCFADGSFFIRLPSLPGLNFISHCLRGAHLFSFQSLSSILPRLGIQQSPSTIHPSIHPSVHTLNRIHQPPCWYLEHKGVTDSIREAYLRPVQDTDIYTGWAHRMSFVLGDACGPVGHRCSQGEIRCQIAVSPEEKTTAPEALLPSGAIIHSHHSH